MSNAEPKLAHLAPQAATVTNEQPNFTPEELNLLAQADRQCCANSHRAVVYEHRASQITSWIRYQNFASLGVAPGLVLLVTVRDVEWLRALAFALSAACSVATWLWTMFSTVFKWDSQQSTSDDAARRARTLSRKLSNASVRLRTCAPEKREHASSEIEELLRDSDALYEVISNAKVDHSPALELIAQQETLRSFAWMSCGVCNQSWKLGSRVFTRVSDARRFIKKHTAEFESGKRCERCGQEKP